MFISSFDDTLPCDGVFALERQNDLPRLGGDLGPEIGQFLPERPRFRVQGADSRDSLDKRPEKVASCSRSRWINPEARTFGG